MNLVTAEHLTKSYTERLLFDDTDFSINEGDKIGLIGINGTGKSTLLKLVAGLEEPDSGRIVRGRNLDIRYLPQNPVFHPGETVLESVLRENEGHEHVWDIESQAKSMLNRLGIPDFNEKVEHLSGGQKKRAALASVLLSTAELLILDEPTNHLDSEMADWLEDYLKKFKGALLMITHDRYFLDRVVRRIFAFEGGGAIRQYEGGYTDYQAACGERIAAEMEASGTASGQERGRGQKTGGAFGAGTSDAAETAKDKNRGRQREKKLKFSYMEQKEWETIEDDIAALEEAIADLEQQMQDSARDYTALNGIIKEKEEKEALLEEKMDRWMYLNDLAEKIEAQAAAHK